MDTVDFLGDQLSEDQFSIKSFAVFETHCSDTIVDLSDCNGLDSEKIFPLMYLRSIVTILENNLINKFD